MRPPPPPRPSPPPPGYLLPDPPPPPPQLPPNPLAPPALSSGRTDIGLAALALFAAGLLACARHLRAMRERRLRGEPMRTSEGAATPDEVVDVVVDLGDEHVVQVPRRSLKSAKTLRAAIAKAMIARLDEGAPRAWLAAKGRSAALAKSMSVTLTFDNQIDEPTSARLTESTPAERILEATSVLVLPT